MSQNIKRVRFYDPIVEYGHKEFNELFVSKFESNYHSQLKINSNNMGFLRYHLSSFVNHYKLVKEAEKQDIFLLFNNLSLFLMTFIFKDIKSHFVVHNNLDFASKSKIHFFMYKRIASKVKLIYLEKRLKLEAEFLFNHNHSSVILHPVINVIPSGTKEKTNVFVSSRNLTQKQLVKICELESKKTVICNKFFTNVFNKNLKMGHIDDFDKMLNSCSKVYITGDYKYRASGILYKSLSIDGLKIYLTDKSYYQEVKGRFKKIKNKFTLIENE